MIDQRPNVYYVCRECEDLGKITPPCEHFKENYKLHYGRTTESKKDRQSRKEIFIARATKHFDSPELRKEADELFEKANPRQNEK